MIDTDDLDNMSRRDLVELLEAYKYWLARAGQLSALADALWDLIPSYLSTEATDIWNEYNGDEEE